MPRVPPVVTDPAGKPGAVVRPDAGGMMILKERVFAVEEKT
jgi:hypothetical protein